MPGISMTGPLPLYSSGRAEHTLLNAQADQIQLTEEDYKAIDQAYPPPVRKEYLDIQ